MNKELEAFRRFRDNAKFDNKTEYYLSTQYIDDSDIVETALKNYEELEQKHNELLYNYEELVHCGMKSEQKKLEALEVIRTKQVNIGAFYVFDNLEQYNHYCDMVGGCKKLTQEEYELLKEVLK